MIRFPTPKTNDSTELKDRTDKFFVKQIPAILLRKYSLTPLQKEVLNELHYQCYLRTDRDPFETSYQEFAVYLGRAEHSVKEAVEYLSKLSIIEVISITKGMKRIRFLVNLLEESDKMLSEQIQEYEDSLHGERRRKNSYPKKVNSEPEEKEVSRKENEGSKKQTNSPPPSSSLEEKNKTLKSQFPGFSGF